jgi:glutamate/tyrosine decarboxylase-like PLP-dependent enzyme
LFELAQFAEAQIKASKKLEMVVPRQSLNLCFRYRTQVHTNGDRVNIALREQLKMSGEVMVNYSIFNGGVIIRLVISNPAMKRSDIKQLIARIVKAGAMAEKLSN